MFEVIALTLEDAQAAKAGGAQRIELVGSMEYAGVSPEPHLVEAIVSTVGLPVRPMLRLEDGFVTSDVDRLRNLARDLVSAGSEGPVLGYLRDGKVDVDTVNRILEVLPAGSPWTFHRAIDVAEDYQAAWEDLTKLAWMPDQVLTSGGSGEFPVRLERLRERISRDPVEGPQRILCGGGLKMEHIAPLREVGVRGFHVGSLVRPGGSFDAPIDPALVQEFSAKLA